MGSSHLSSSVTWEEAEGSSSTANRPPGVSYRLNFTVSNWEPSWVRDDLWSGLIVLVSFWILASMTLMFGFYGPINLPLGPNCSQLIQVNPFFVQYIKAQEMEESRHGLMLYGLYETPPLDIEVNWSEMHNAFVSSDHEKNWKYFLHEGASVSISYSVKAPTSVPLSLIIAQGRESFLAWIEDPSYPNTTLSWNIILGNGIIHQEIPMSNMYYIAVGNLNSDDVGVQLNFTVRDFHYDTSNAYYKCSPSHRLCSLKLFLQRANAAVLTSPGISQGVPYDEWYVKLSYGSRWISYFALSGAGTAVLLLVFKLFSTLQTNMVHQTDEMESERRPLLLHKEDDLSSCGSSYDSVSQDEGELEEQMAGGSLDGKPPNEGGSDQSLRRLCAICFDAPRDCFFLPCGHCAVCFTCGKRIMEEAGTCPICRRTMKKVKKIFAV